MGWCAGTRVFDAVADYLHFETDLELDELEPILKVLIKELKDLDWDCECESKFYEDEWYRELLER